MRSPHEKTTIVLCGQPVKVDRGIEHLIRTINRLLYVRTVSCCRGNFDELNLYGYVVIETDGKVSLLTDLVKQLEHLPGFTKFRWPRPSTSAYSKKRTVDTWERMKELERSGVSLYINLRPTKFKSYSPYLDIRFHPDFLPTLCGVFDSILAGQMDSERRQLLTEN